VLLNATRPAVLNEFWWHHTIRSVVLQLDIPLFGLITMSLYGGEWPKNITFDTTAMNI
jgi:hypothetical protein